MARAILFLLIFSMTSILGASACENLFVREVHLVSIQSVLESRNQTHPTFPKATRVTWYKAFPELPDSIMTAFLELPDPIRDRVGSLFSTHRGRPIQFGKDLSTWFYDVVPKTDYTRRAHRILANLSSDSSPNSWYFWMIAPHAYHYLRQWGMKEKHALSHVLEWANTYPHTEELNLKWMDTLSAKPLTRDDIFVPEGESRSPSRLFLDQQGAIVAREMISNRFSSSLDEL